MLRSTLLAVALLTSGLAHADQTSAKVAAPAAVQPCSDYEKDFPPCGISKADRNQAKKLYEMGTKLSRKRQYAEALNKLKEARELSPRDVVYASAQTAVQERLVAEEMRTGNKAMQIGDATKALESFRRAAETDPSNEYAQQRLRDALPAPEEFGSVKLRAVMGEIRLKPAPGAHDFEFKGSSADVLDRFARGFGISTVSEQDLVTRPVRVKLDNVDWATGSQILGQAYKILIIPLSEKQVLLAKDSEENRRDLTRMILRTFYAQGGSTPQDLTDITTALRIMFDLRFITQNAAAGTITVRAPQATVDAIVNFLDFMQDERPSVMLDVKIFEVSSTLSRDVGTSVPNQFSVFNVTTEIQKLVNGSSFQQIVAALSASGQPVNASTILAALLASAASTSSSVLGQPFGTFGGGLTLTGVTIPTTSVHLSANNSLARTVEDVLLRAGHGKAATLKVGQRFPIVSSQFAASSSAGSLLSSLGITTGVAAAVPSPQFTYEDLGLTLKATPQVHGTLVSLEYELTLRALGATQVNGLPLITNTEMKGTISTEDGQSVVMAGMVSKSQIASINGIPLLSMIPVLGRGFSVESKQNEVDELLVVITPHITSGHGEKDSYIPIPMNGPK
jgi:general secretion pathway protein D